MKRTFSLISACVRHFIVLFAVAVVAVSGKSVFAQEYTFEELCVLALERAEKIKMSEEDLFIAEKGKDKAVSALMPRIAAFGDYTRYNEDKNSSLGFTIQPEYSSSWGVRLDQTFSLGGKEFAGIRVSEINIEKSRQNAFSIKEGYLMFFSGAYFNVLRAARSVEIAKANFDRLQKHRDAAEVRLRLGEVTKTALLRSEAELSGAKTEKIRSENNLKIAKTVMSRLAGLRSDFQLKDDPGSQSWNNIQEESLDLLKQKALHERAEINAAGLQRKIAAEQVRYARSSYWPAVSVEGVYLRKDEDPPTPFFNKEVIYGGLNFVFPLFEGGLRKAEIMESRSKERQAVLAFEDISRNIEVEVEDAYLEYLTQKGVLRALEDQLVFAADNYRAVSKQFEFGLSDSINVMDANTLLVTSERQLSDARYAYRLSVLKVKKATGTLLKTFVNKELKAGK
jgi:outer membrane protein